MLVLKLAGYKESTDVITNVFMRIVFWYFILVCTWIPECSFIIFILSHIYISLMFCYYISCIYSYRLWNVYGQCHHKDPQIFHEQCTIKKVRNVVMKIFNGPIISVHLFVILFFLQNLKFKCKINNNKQQIINLTLQWMYDFLNLTYAIHHDDSDLTLTLTNIWSSTQSL